MTSTASRSVADAPREASPDRVEAVAAGLRRTFAAGKTRDIKWRRKQLKQIVKLAQENEAAISEALGSDVDRRGHEAWFGDIAPVVAEADYARKHLRRWMRRRRTTLPMSFQPAKGFYQYEPLGTVLVIGPWNYPLYLTLGPLVGAIAAGNTVVIKPSEHAPATSALLAELIPRYLDKDAVVVIEGAVQTTQLLIDQALDHIFFTGGPEIGKKIMEAAAKHLTPVTLELGGKCPVIVTRDADIEVAGRRIAWMKLLNSGQTCIAPDYVLVERSVKDDLVKQITSTLVDFRKDLPAGQKVVNERQHARIAGYLKDSGGEIVAGGTVDDDALTIEPTVVVDPDPTSKLMQEEIFGPVLPVVGVDSFDSAIRFVTDRPKPLGAYLFSSSRTAKDRVVNEISSGGTVINHLAMHCLAPQLPFGGVGMSGMGAYHGKWGFECFSHRKAVVVKTARPDPDLMYPPYTDTKQKLIRKFF